jgi:hypothetical protein
VDKLTNTRFEPSGFTENPSIRYASSVLDYIARWLGGKFLSPEYLKPRIGEQHIREDLGRIPSFQDWATAVRMQPWMYGQRLTKTTEV